MGYSISVSVRSQRLKEEMHAFLQDVYRPWYAVAGYDEELTDFRGPQIDVAESKCSLGFSYQSGVQPERAYVFALIRWVAIKVSRTKSAFRGEGLTFDRAVPYWVYDGLETFPILIEGQWKHDPELENYFCDELGFATNDRVARELAWYCLPEGTYETITALSQGKTSDQIREMFIKAGLDGAKQTLTTMKSELARLDVLWNER